MTRTMSATEARVHFGELIRIVGSGERVIVERRGKPAVIGIHPKELERLKSMHPNWEASVASFVERQGSATRLPQTPDAER